MLGRFLIQFSALQDGRKIGYGGMQGIPMVATSPGKNSLHILQLFVFLFIFVFIFVFVFVFV